jgi:glutamate synthase (NADPH/NADH) small chain
MRAARRQGARPLPVAGVGNAAADEATGKTSKACVWAGGDVVTGAATVILAMGAGRRVARNMHEYLQTVPPKSKRG